MSTKKFPYTIIWNIMCIKFMTERLPKSNYLRSHFKSLIQLQMEVGLTGVDGTRVLRCVGEALKLGVGFVTIHLLPLSDSFVLVTLWM